MGENASLQKMFINTTALGEFTIHSWVKECGMASLGNIVNSSELVPKNRELQKIRQNLHVEFLNEIPILPSLLWTTEFREIIPSTHF